MTAVVAVPLVVAWIPFNRTTRDVESADKVARRIEGVWSTKFRDAEDATVRRTWSFRDDGTGLVRDALPGRSTTRAFEYEVSDYVLRVTFDRDGREASTTIDFASGGVELEQDPVDRQTRLYSRRRGRSDYPHVYGTFAAWSSDGAFEMYQMTSPSFGGRGRGWVHRGNATEWTTEPFEYQSYRRRLVLRYPHREEPNKEAFAEIGSRALYRPWLSVDGETCAFVLSRARYSRWFVGQPLPYVDAARPATVADRHERRCQEGATLLTTKI